MSRCVVGLLLVCVVIAGCGGSGSTKTVTVGTSAARSGTTTAPASTTGARAPASKTGPALASRDGLVDKQPVTLQIAELKRSGSTTALILRLQEGPGAGTTAQVAETFDDGLFEKQTGNGATSISGGSSLDGVFLIDAKNRKKYLVGRDPTGACACESNLSTAFVGKSAPLLLSATFGAPPADVRAVDVFVPHFGTFKDVPLG